MSASDVFNLALPVYCHAQTTPRNVALVVDDREHTYEHLAHVAGRVASWLSSIAHPRVGILANRSLETYAGILGTAWAGGTYVPLNPKQPAARMSLVIHRAGLDALIVDARGAGQLKDLGDALPPRILIGEGVGDTGLPLRGATPWNDLGSLPAPSAPKPLDPDHPAYIIFTSGTTGVPKGVIVTVSNVAHFLAVIRSLYHYTPRDRFSQFIETTFDVAVQEIFSCFDAGGSLHVIPEGKLMGPGGFIRQRELTVFQAVPSVILTMQRMKQLAPNSMPSLKVSFFGGEGMPIAAMQAWQAAAPNGIVENFYGPTEATVACTYQRLTDPPVLTPGRDIVAIGKPFPGTECAIVDADMNFLAPNQIGELALHGPQIAAGYLGDEELTARRFPTLDHPRLGRSRWYLSGDSALYDDAGVYHCLGRIDNQVKVMGHRVELEEIEAHLRAVCSTECVAAVAWPVVNGNPAGVVAFVSGGRLPASSVRDELRQRVPVYMIPAKVISLETMPLSTNGKVDRHALRAMLDREAVS